MTDTIFADGLIAKKPHDNAPDFIITKLSFKVDEFIETMNNHKINGWFNVEVKESKKGTYYAEVDTWKPESKSEAKRVEIQKEDVSQEDSLPF